MYHCIFANKLYRIKVIGISGAGKWVLMHHKSRQQQLLSYKAGEKIVLVIYDLNDLLPINA